MLESILLISCAGTALAALIVLLKPLTYRIFPRGWHYYIWLAVLAVMLLPVRFSPPAAVERVTVGVAATRNYSELEAKVYNTYDGGRSISADMLWLCIAALLLASRLGGYAAFVCRIRRSSIELDCPQLAKITVLKSSAAASPLMYGIIKPVLVLPDIDMTPERLRNVLAHEMTHFRRRDILWKWFAVVVKCVHWFNPAVYFICRRMNVECEISCDAAVVEKMSADRLIAGTDRAAAGDNVDLKREYLLFDYSFDSRAEYTINITPDAGGRVSVFFDTDSPAITAEISLTPKNGAAQWHRMPTDSSLAYCFSGYDANKEYVLGIRGYCPGNYGINGKILVY